MVVWGIADEDEPREGRDQTGWTSRGGEGTAGQKVLESEKNIESRQRAGCP